MAQLSDSIEKFIKSLMDEGTQVELKRNELAQHFNCAPSQINYVLATRFSIHHGYVIESRRGGGGYVRIVRMCQSNETNLLSILLEQVGDSIDEENAVAIIKHVLEMHLVTTNEALIMRSAITQSALGLPVSAKNMLRAAVLSSMLKQVFRNAQREDKK